MKENKLPNQNFSYQNTFSFILSGVKLFDRSNKDYLRYRHRSLPDNRRTTKLLNIIQNCEWFLISIENLPTAKTLIKCFRYKTTFVIMAIVVLIMSWEKMIICDNHVLYWNKQPLWRMHNNDDHNWLFAKSYRMVPTSKSNRLKTNKRF